MSFLERALFWRYFHRYDWMLEKLWEARHAYNEQVDLLERLAEEKPARAFIICPDNLPLVRFLSRDHRKINRTIDLGYKKVEKIQEEIADFMQKSTGSGLHDCQKR